MPETSFTRTISNPEVVMKRRRQQKLEKRMQEFMSSDGRPDSGKWPRPGAHGDHGSSEPEGEGVGPLGRLPQTAENF